MAPTFLHVVLPLVVFSMLSAQVQAEQHIIRFENKCGHGTPQLIQEATVLSSGQDYVSDGPLSSAIAYLQTGDCGFNGENCTLIEITLNNPSCPGCGSSTDISLISPHALNVEAGFSYFGGCDGTGATCSTSVCKSAFLQPDDTQVQVSCQTNNVNLLITFCGSSGGSAAASPSSNKADVPVASSEAAASPTVPVNAAPSPSAGSPSSSAVEVSPTAPAPQPSTASSCHKGQPKRRSVVQARAVPEDFMIRASDPRARAMYDAHRRHHAKMAGRHVPRPPA